MGTYVEGGLPVAPSKDRLVEKWVYFAKVDNFDFQFINLE